MTGVGGVGVGGVRRGRIGAASSQAGHGSSASAFRMPEAAPGVLGTGAVAAPSLLGLQEAAEPEVRDRDARRHGNALLAGLAALQRAMLGGAGTGAGTGAEAGTLAQLDTLLKTVPVPDDPRLAELQRALLVRTAVELARRRAAAPA